MNYLVDYHVHSIFSSDGHNTIMDMCRSAVNKGIKEIAVTDHFEPHISNEDYPFYNQKGYWALMTKAKQVFSSVLSLELNLVSRICFRRYPVQYLKAFHTIMSWHLHTSFRLVWTYRKLISAV